MRLSVTLKNAIKETVDGVRLLSVPGSIDSELPYVFAFGCVGYEPVHFMCAAQSCRSNDDNCSVNRYENGYSQIDWNSTSPTGLVGEAASLWGADL